MRTIALRRAALALLALLPTVPALHAQTTETVFFTGPDNQISSAAFGPTCAGPGSSSAVVTDGGTNLNGIVAWGFRPDPQASTEEICVAAANATQGGGLRLYNATTRANVGQVAGFDSAVAVDVDSSGNLFAVNDDPGGPDRLLLVRRGDGAECTRGAYDASSLLLIPVHDVFRLADVKFVRASRPQSVATAGDVLVLVRNPARFVKFTSDELAKGAAATGESLAAPNLSGHEPTGFAITLTGEILVATAGGRILRFGPDGAALGDFVPPFSGNGVDVATGFQEGVEHVFLTVHQGGLVRRYDLAGSCTGAVTGVNAPVGVGNASLNARGAAVTPSGALVTVAPTSAQTVTYEVSGGGQTSSRVHLLCGAPAGELVLDSGPTGVTIPSNVQPFHNETCGGSAYLVYEGESNAGSFGAEIEHHIEENLLGFATECEAGEQPRTFWAPDANDPPIVEGSTFTDISTGCGSNIGRGGGFSYVLTGWDTRPLREIAAEKLQNLGLALNGTDPASGGLGGLIGGKTRRALQSLLKSAMRAFDRDDLATTQAKLESFIATVKGNLGSFQSGRNAPGELAARANSAAYMVCGVETTTGGNIVPAGCNRRLDPLL